MIFRVIIVASFLIVNLNNASSQTFQWAKNIGSVSSEAAMDIATDSDGNSYVVGNFQNTFTIGNDTLTSAGTTDIFIVKIDAFGNSVWAKRAGGTGVDEARSVSIGPSGNIFVTGKIGSSAEFGTISLTNYSYSTNWFFAKYSINGDCLMAKYSFVGSTGSSNDVVEDLFGNIFVTGNATNGTSFGSVSLSGSGFLAKYDNQGICSWAKQCGTGNSICTDDLGFVYVAGAFTGSKNFDTLSLTSTSAKDAFVAKYTNNGSIVWVKKGGGSENDEANGITTDKYNNVIITGEFYNSANFDNLNIVATGYSGWEDLFIASYSPNGTINWLKKYGSSGQDAGEAVITDKNGNIYVAGDFLSKAGILIFDTGGQLLHSVTGKGTGTSYSMGIGIDNKDNIYIAGFSNGSVSYGSITAPGISSGDAFIAKHSDFLKTLSISSSNLCPSQEIEVSYSVKENCNANNIFTAELSSSSGSFSSPIVIGELSSNESGIMTCKIPENITAGNGYRIRVNSSLPFTIGNDNGANLNINSNTIINANPLNKTVCTGSNTNFLVSVSGAAQTYQWQENRGIGFFNLTEGGIYSGVASNNLNLVGINESMNNYQYCCIVNSYCGPELISNSANLVVISKPIITLHPIDKTVCGGNVVFLVAATSGTLNYQWQVDDGGGFVNLSNGANYSGTNATSLYVSNINLSYNGYKYRCLVTGCSPSDTSISNSANLTVGNTPNITLQPKDKFECPGSSVSFQINAFSGSSLSYQWQENRGSGFVNLVNSAPYSNVYTAGLTISVIDSLMNNYKYRCVVTGCNPDSSIYSNEVGLSIINSPKIISSSFSQMVCEDSDCQFSISVSGSYLIYQWQKDNGNGFMDISDGGLFSGTNTSVLKINKADFSIDGTFLRCRVSGCLSGSASVTDSILLTISSKPNLILQSSISSCDSIDLSNLIDNNFTDEIISYWIDHTAQYSPHINPTSIWNTGTYYIKKTTLNGCSNIKPIDVTILHADTFNFSSSICQGDSIVFGAEIIRSSGTYYDTFSRITGCDSIVSLSVSVNPSYNQNLFDTICQGDSVFFAGNYYSSEGVYFKNYQTIYNCDSINTLYLSVNPIYNDSQSSNICQGDSIFFLGDYYTSSGTYSKSFQTFNGCDSIFSLILNVTPTFVQNQSSIICQGDSVYFEGVYYYSEGVYFKYYQSINGCDSLKTIELTVNPSFNENQLTHICQGDSIFFQGDYYTTSGTYSKSFQSINGCDSLIILNLNVDKLNLSISKNDNTLVTDISGANYQWINCDDGSSIIGAIDQDFAPTQSGNYGVIVNDGNCSDTSDCLNVIITGIEINHSDHFFSIYPNPTDNSLIINTGNVTAKTISLFNLLGENLITIKPLSQLSMIDLRDFSAGSYFIQVQTEKSIGILKMIKN